MDGPIDTDVAIEAPEHIVFSHRVAGPGRRAIAYMLDIVICYGMLLLFSIAVLIAVGGFAALTHAADELPKASIGLILLAVFFAQWIYFAAWEGWTGRTPGKTAMRLRVLTTTGRPIQLVEAALRNILRAADALPTAFAVGVVSMALTRRFQRLGDLVAGTMVVVEAKPGVAAPVKLWPPPTQEESWSLPERVALDAEERAALELFLRRRGTLGPEREWELAAVVAGMFERKFGFRASDPVRTLALLYDAAVNAGRSEAPPSSRVPDSYRSPWHDAEPGGRR